jgi:iron complex outermembrane receptor protein
VGAPLSGENNVQPGDWLPLVPDHQVKAGGLLSLPVGLQFGADVRYIGAQWLRGDEANETSRLKGYAVANLRAGFRRANWELSVIVANAFNHQGAVFGTFNENRQTGALERFLTPMNARTLKVVLRRGFGG